MKSFFLAAWLLSLFAPVAIVQGQNLAIIIRNVKNDKGLVRAALFTSEKEFMKTKWRKASTPARAGEVRIVFDNVPPGTYAVSVVHDVNLNDEMDSNAMGIPKEGFGFSNNALATFGPPSFSEAKWDWDGQKEMVITLKYY